MLKGFKDFILRGNVIYLAVAVVIGGAFTALIGVVGAQLIQPVINSFFYLIGIGKDGIGGSVSLPGDQQIGLGAITTAAIVFLVTAAVVYFIFVAPMNHAKERLAKRAGVAEEPEPEPADLELLRQIRDLLSEQRRSTGGSPDSGR